MTHFNMKTKEGIVAKKKNTDNLSQIRERSENQVREPAGALEFLVLFKIELIVDVS